MKHTCRYIPILLALILALMTSTALAGKVHNLTPAQARKAIAATPDLVILDIRTPGEFHAGHLKNARNIDFYGKNFKARIDGLDKAVPYFVYCRSGRRSSIAIEYMQQVGFDTIYHLGNGINGWTGANLPLVR
ncbi:rhodanese-like domain-containing protein [Pseudodesulfovibrio sp.]|nr:rhodanese-like domain-containing protein [Pseudodesulfovibrio sp.]